MVIYWPLYYFDTELTSWNLGFLSTLRGYAFSHYPYFPDILYHGDSDANIDLGRESLLLQMSGAPCPKVIELTQIHVLLVSATLCLLPGPGGGRSLKPCLNNGERVCCQLSGNLVC